MGSYLLKSQSFNLASLADFKQYSNWNLQNNPDFLLVTLVADNSNIRIEDYPQLHNWFQAKPFNHESKLLVIFPAHTLTIGFQNSLLKILEEHPEYLNVILVTDSPNKLLKTVLSRLITLQPEKYTESSDLINFDLGNIQDINLLSKNRKQAIDTLLSLYAESKSLDLANPETIKTQAAYLHAISALKRSANTKLTLLNLAISIKKVKSTAL